MLIETLRKAAMPKKPKPFGVGPSDLAKLKYKGFSDQELLTVHQSLKAYRPNAGTIATSMATVMLADLVLALRARGITFEIPLR